MNVTKHLLLQRILHPRRINRDWQNNFGPDVENNMQNRYNDVEPARFIKAISTGQLFIGIDSKNEYILSGPCVRSDIKPGECGTLYAALGCLYFRSDLDHKPCPGCEDIGFRSIVDGVRVPCNICKPA